MEESLVLEVEYPTTYHEKLTKMMVQLVLQGGSSFRQKMISKYS